MSEPPSEPPSQPPSGPLSGPLSGSRPEAPAEPLFRTDGSRFVPSPFTAGPWSAAAQHGGPPSGLLARACERHRTTPDEDPAAYLTSRVTVELMRPVPLEPLELTVTTLRPGWKVQLVGASLWAGGGPGAGTEVARATALRLRRAPLELPAVTVAANAGVDDHLTSLPAPAAGLRPQRHVSTGAAVAFHADAAELRFVRGAIDRPGPGTMWARLLTRLVDDEPVSAVQRAVTLADFGNAVGSVLPMETHTYINADLTVNLVREPVGEWIGLESVVRADAAGTGLAAGLLFDVHGAFGRSTQSLLIAAR